MPTVPYMRPAMGFRPETNPKPLAGLKGIGDLTFGGCVQGYDADSNPVACNDPSAVVWMDAAGNTVAAGTPAGLPSGPTPNEAPSGAYLTYNGTWSSTPFTSAKTIFQNVINSLNGQGLQVTASNLDANFWANYGKSSTPFSVVLQLRVTGSGFAHADDARSIVDHFVYTASGRMPQGSSIFVASAPPAPRDPGMSAQPPGTFTAWLEQNAVWIGMGLVALVAGRN